jgi:ribose transport system substrate-binding protein
MRLRTRAVLAFAAAAGIALTGCGSGSTPTAGSNTKSGPFSIGVSNAFVGSEYRTQMISDIQTTFDEYKTAGLVSTLVLENADADVNGQIQQIRNLINKRVNVIIVDPNSATALNAVFKEATDQGIKVYAIDQAVTAPNVTNVGIDQGAWAAQSANWLAGKVGKGGKIVAVNGISGNPANEARWSAAKAIFDKAGVVVLTTADGGWDQAKGQTVMSNLLATYPNIQGVWTQDGMAQGVFKATQAAGKIDKVFVTGEARNGFMRTWNDLQPKFSSVGVVNPPGTGATALHFAIGELQGKKIDPAKLTDGHSVVLPLEPTIDNTNLAATWASVKDKPDSYVLDSVLTKDAVAKYFS